MKDFNSSPYGGIVYNVTTKVEQNIAEKWLTWLKEEYIPDLIKTGCFTHAVIMQLTEVGEKKQQTNGIINSFHIAA